MTTNFDDVDRRLRGAFSATPADSAGQASLLDPDQLANRRVKASSPKARVAGAIGGVTGGLATLAVLTLATTSALTPQTPLFTLAEGGGAGGASLSAESADMRIGVWVDYRYIAGDTLSKDTGRGDVYQLALSGSAESILSDVGQAFGLTGPIKETDYFDPNYPSYLIGSTDWSAGPSVTLTWMGTGSWWYSNPVAYPEPDCEDTKEGDAGGDGIIQCTQPAPTGSLPSTEQAKQLAADIFSQTGLLVSANDVRLIYADEWGMSLAASLVVAGERTAIEWSLGLAPGGVISYASGHAVTVTNRGTFDTISPFDAVDRISPGNWWGSPGPDFYDYAPLAAETRVADSGIATPYSGDTEDPDSGDTGGTPDPNTPPGSTPPGTQPSEPGDGDTVSDPVQPVDPNTPVDSGVIIDPAPGEEVPWPTEPEVVDVVVYEATSALVLVYDLNGGAWLVPGFVMTHDQGWWVSVISLVEGVIDVPEPVDYSILPIPEPMVEPEVVD